MGAKGTELVGLGVDDDPEFFHDKLDGIYKSLGLPAEGARIDTTQAQALARRHGLVIPGATDWMPRLR